METLMVLWEKFIPFANLGNRLRSHPLAYLHLRSELHI